MVVRLVGHQREEGPPVIDEADEIAHGQRAELPTRRKKRWRQRAAQKEGRRCQFLRTKTRRS